MDILKLGEKISKLTIYKFAFYDKHHRKHYECICDCGNRKTIQGSLIKSGNTKSCGCFSKEQKKATRISENHTEITAIILGYKRNAKNRNIDWKLTRKEVETLIKQNCYYCGSTPSNRKTTKNSINGGFIYSGIDRVNSFQGYEINNVVPCCKICNIAKQNMSISDFKYWINKISIRVDQWDNL